MPVLKDIPVLGWLFKNRTTVNAKRELIVFITPSIVDSDGDMIDERQEGIFEDLRERRADQEAQEVGR